MIILTLEMSYSSRLSTTSLFVYYIEVHDTSFFVSNESFPDWGQKIWAAFDC